MNRNTTWLGVGNKTGGTLFVTGMETMQGKVWSLASIAETHEFQMLSIRIGLGLGASTGYMGVIIYNCLNLWELNGKTNNDWGFNLSFGEKWSDVAKGLATLKYATTIAKVCRATRTTPADMETMRNAASYLYNTYDIATMSGPKLVTIDTPLGAGLELSAHYQEGKMEILN